MTSRPNVPAICPSASSIIWSAASLRRVPWGEFPDLFGTISRLRLLAPRRASLRLLRSALPPLRPPSLPRSGTIPRGPGPFLSRRPRRLSTVEKTRYPRFLDDPCVHAPLSDPGGPPPPRPLQGRRWCLPRSRPRRLRHAPISGLHHAACTPSVYASKPGSPPDNATLDSGRWPTLTGRDSHPLGRVEDFRRVFPFTSPSLLTKLCLAQREMARHRGLSACRSAPRAARGACCSDTWAIANRRLKITERSAIVPAPLPHLPAGAGISRKPPVPRS